MPVHYFAPYFALFRINPSDNRDDEGFTGHIEDSASGLTYMQARYYDSVVGRFLSNDPVGFLVDKPMQFNRYAYANNDPVNKVDPDGKLACGGLCIGAAIILGKAAIGAAVSYAAARVSGADSNTAFKQAGVGAVVGAVTAPGASLAVKGGANMFATSAVQGAISSAVSQKVVKGEVTVRETVIAAAIAPIAAGVEATALAIGAPPLEAQVNHFSRWVIRSDISCNVC